MFTLQPLMLPVRTQALAFKGSPSHSNQNPSDQMDWSSEQPQDSLDLSQQQKKIELQTKLQNKFSELLKKDPYSTEWDLKQAAGDILLREPDHKNIISSDHLAGMVRTARTQAQSNAKARRAPGPRGIKRKSGLME